MFKMRTWHWLYAGSFLFLGLTILMVYQVTRTGDLSLEWPLLVFMTLAMVSFLVGWFMERAHKKKQPEARMEDLI
jgi:membrane protein implicated in regulation of membrane protease activity